MRSTEPIRCVVCQDAGTLIAVDGEQGRGRVLASYPGAGSLPARVVVACPNCASGTHTPPVNYLDGLDVYAHQRAAVAAARELALADSPAGWLVLLGGYGSGKTTIAEATVATLRSRGLHLRSYSAPELKNELFESFRAGTYGAWLGSLTRARGLCIDELDCVSWGNEHVEETMSELINARYRQAATTLTILAGATLEHVPARIVSRIRQFGVHDLGAVDLRQPDPSPYAGAWDTGESYR